MHPIFLLKTHVNFYLKIWSRLNQVKSIICSGLLYLHFCIIIFYLKLLQYFTLCNFPHTFFFVCKKGEGKPKLLITCRLLITPLLKRIGYLKLLFLTACFTLLGKRKHANLIGNIAQRSTVKLQTYLASLVILMWLILHNLIKVTFCYRTNNIIEMLNLHDSRHYNPNCLYSAYLSNTFLCKNITSRPRRWWGQFLKAAHSYTLQVVQ